MRTELYWIEGPWQSKLAILPRPRGGDWLEDEIQGWRAAGVDVVVSLLTSDEVADFNLAREGSLCEAHGIDFRSFPIVDRSVPVSRKATLDFVKKLAELLAEGKTITIHCRQGIGRSALIAASLLVLSGIVPDAAFLRVSEGRDVLFRKHLSSGNGLWSLRTATYLRLATNSCERCCAFQRTYRA